MPSDQDIITQILGYIIAVYLAFWPLFVLCGAIWMCSMLILRACEWVAKDKPSLQSNLDQLKFSLKKIQISLEKKVRFITFYDKLSERTKLKFYLLINIIIHSLWFLGLFMIIYFNLDNPLMEYQLIERGIVTKGVISEVESIENREDQNDSYTIKYNFKINSGSQINSSCQIEGERPDEFSYDADYPIPINIVYLYEKPYANKPKNELKSKISLRNEIGLGVLFFLILSIPMVLKIRNLIKQDLN